MSHAAETASSPKADLVSWLLTVVTVAMLLIVSGAFAVLIPKFEMIYKDLGIALPVLTERVVVIHRSFLWTALIALALANVIKEIRWNGYPGIAAFNVCGFFFAFGVAVAAVVGLFLPIIGIIEVHSAHSQP